MPRWLPVVILLAACDQGPDEAFPVPFELSPDTLEVTIPLANYTAPARFQQFLIENTGAIPIFVSPAFNLATGEENTSGVDPDLLVTLVTTDFAPLTQVSPGQTKPMQVTLDHRPWRWTTGEYTIHVPLDLRYLWSGQDVGEPDPGEDEVPTIKSARQDLTIHFSIDCDLDDDTYDAIDCGGPDTDDLDEFVHPGVDETCDGVDEDSDGAIDEDAIDRQTWYFDGDADTFGDPENSVLACTRPSASWRTEAGDCDDDDRNANPDTREACANGKDDDCDGKIDGADPDC